MKEEKDKKVESESPFDAKVSTEEDGARPAGWRG